jgi:hypothetical protein
VKDASTVRIPLLTPGSGTSVRIETDTEVITQIVRSRAAMRSLREEGLLSHDQALFIDHDSLAHGLIILRVEYQNVAMRMYVIEERITHEGFEILRSYGPSAS